MSVYYINYFVMIIGVITILAAIILLFLDKLKGEDIYFNIDVKEQELKKVIEDAEEIITELNYTSEMIVQEIEEKLNNINRLNFTYANTEMPNEINYVKSSELNKKDNNIDSKISNVIDNQPNELSEHIKNNRVNLTDKQKTVLEYTAQGMDITEIAKTMNIGKGEVMLILSLLNGVNNNGQI